MNGKGKGRSQASPRSLARLPPGTPRLWHCHSRPPTLTLHLHTPSSTVSASSPWALLASPPCPQRTQVRPCTCPWPRRCPWGLWAPPWPICPWARCTHQDPPCCWKALTPEPGWAQGAPAASRRRLPRVPRARPPCPSCPEPPCCCPHARGASRGGPGAPSASGEGGSGLGGPPRPSAPPPGTWAGAGEPQRPGGDTPGDTRVTGEGFG